MQKVTRTASGRLSSVAGLFHPFVGVSSRLLTRLDNRDRRRMNETEASMGPKDGDPEAMDILEPQFPTGEAAREEAAVGSPAAGAQDAGKPVVAIATVEDEPKEKKLSKNQKKKLAKLQRFADTREQWKADKREKKKAAKQRKRELAEAQSGSEKSSAGLKRKADGEEEKVGPGNGRVSGDVESEPTKKKQKTQAQQPQRVLEPITFIMDCGFDDKMNDKEIISMSSQLTRCYAVNRLSTRQVTLRVTSLNGRLLERYQTAINNQHLRWKSVRFSDSEYEVTEENRDDLIYLTADSPDTIEDLEAGKSYIIGGIVDRNRYKSLCYDKAVAQGIRTAKLPIGDYIKMASRFVLTTNQVVEIMLKYLECRDWKAAFMEVIPQRKQPKIKPQSGAEADGQAGEAEEEDEEMESEENERAAERERSTPDALSSSSSGSRNMAEAREQKHL